jgi:hypothetical protein
MADKLPIGEPVFQVEDTVAIDVGSAEKLDEADDRPVAVLWVPDIEQRHGWREYYVKKQAPKSNGKLIGFRKRQP